MAPTEAQVEEAEALRELGNAAFGKNNTSPPLKTEAKSGGAQINTVSHPIALGSFLPRMLPIRKRFI